MLCQLPQKRIHRRSFNESGHAHELTFSCFGQYPFLAKDRTCEWLAKSIRDACFEMEFSLWAFVFMPEHVHLLVHPDNSEYDVSEFLAAVKHPVSRQAIAFLRRESPEWLDKLKVQRARRIEYHFWKKGGGYDRNITEPKTLEKMIDYIHMNPVRKSFVQRAIDWKWSSARWFMLQEQLTELPVAQLPIEWTIGMSDG
jgi:putative transposase